MRLLVTLLCVVFAACGGEGVSGSRCVVVFVDVSGSVKDYAVYRDAWMKIVNHLESGDRVVLARITDETYTRFGSVVDSALPAFNPLKHNKPRFEKEVGEIRVALHSALDSALAAPRSPKTDILNSLVIAEKIFAGDDRRPVLVLLSDMLEDSREHNFERTRLDESFITKLIERQRQRGRLPDLRGASVYVAGASARTAEKAHEVQEFWIAYIRAAQGQILPQHYGPALLSFKGSSS